MFPPLSDVMFAELFRNLPQNSGVFSRFQSTKAVFLCSSVLDHR